MKSYLQRVIVGAYAGTCVGVAAALCFIHAAGAGVLT